MLPKAWNTLISSNEDEPIIELFNDTLEKISGFRSSPQEIAEFLEKNRAKLLILEEQPTQVIRKAREIEYLPENEEEKTSKYIRTGFTGKSINSFIFNDKKYEAKSWKQLLLAICDELNNLHKKDFDRVLSLKGRKRPYFTKNQNELRVPDKIKGTDIFVETNLSANSMISLCEDVLSLFGYKDSLKIELE